MKEGNNYATHCGIFLYIIGVKTHVVNPTYPRLPLTAPDSLEESRTMGTDSHDEDSGGEYGYGGNARSKRAFSVADVEMEYVGSLSMVGDWGISEGDMRSTYIIGCIAE